MLLGKLIDISHHPSPSIIFRNPYQLNQFDLTTKLFPLILYIFVV